MQYLATVTYAIIKSTFIVCSLLLHRWRLLTSKGIVGRCISDFSSLPWQWPQSPLLPSLLSLTADQSHFSLCSTPSKTFVFLSRSFSLQLSHLLPPCCYINFTETKKQGPQGWLDVKGRRGASMRGEQMQRVVSSHMLYEKDVENWSNWLYFMEEPSFPPSNLQQKLLSEENAEKNFYWH